MASIHYCESTFFPAAIKAFYLLKCKQHSSIAMANSFHLNRKGKAQKLCGRLQATHAFPLRFHDLDSITCRRRGLGQANAKKRLAELIGCCRDYFEIKTYT